VFSSIGIKSRLTKIFLYKKSKKDWEMPHFFKKTKIIIRENHAGQDKWGFQNFSLPLLQ